MSTTTSSPSKPKAKKRKKFNWLFLFTVIIPTLCATTYYAFFASDVYISDSSFVVRSPNNQQSFSGVGSLLQTAGFSRSQDDTYTVQEYIRSRSALDALQQIMPVRAYYETQGDLLSRFNPFGIQGEQEAFFQYFQKRETVSVDAVSGIATLSIRAFNAEEAQKINQALLAQAETLINRLNSRARQDTVRFAEQAVNEAEQKVNATANALSKYRVKNEIYDVKAQSEVQQSLISKLQGELIYVQTQLQQVRAMAPDNPQVKTLETREASLSAEIKKQTKAMLGGGKSTATQTAEYQRLTLENTLAQQQLTSAMTSLLNTRAEADRQQLYLEVINPPSKPDLALEPYRIYNSIATFIIGFILYGVLSLLLASVREHKN